MEGEEIRSEKKDIPVPRIRHVKNEWSGGGNGCVLVVLDQKARRGGRSRHDDRRPRSPAK